MLRFETGRNSGVIIHGLVTISGVHVGNSDGLGVLMLSVMLFCVNFFVLLEVLGSLEGLFTDLKNTIRMVAVNNEGTRTHIAYMGFERCMNYR